MNRTVNREQQAPNFAMLDSDVIFYGDDGDVASVLVRAGLSREMGCVYEGRQKARATAFKHCEYLKFKV